MSAEPLPNDAPDLNVVGQDGVVMPRPGAAKKTALILLKDDFHPTVIYPTGVIVHDDLGPETGKRPMGNGWGREQITAQQIVLRFDRYPNAGVGICLGPGKAPHGEWLI